MDGITEVQMTQSGLKTEFLAFQMPPTQSSIETTREIEYSPLAAINPNANTQLIEFHIPGSSEEFIDLDSVYLYVKLRYGAKYETTAAGVKTQVKCTLDNMGLVNNALHSLFERVELQIGSTTINEVPNLYQYRAYIENLLGYSAEAKKTILQPVGWYLDYKDDPTSPSPVRGEKFAPYIDHEFYGTLHLDLAGQDKLIMNGTSIGLKLTTSPKSFFLHGKSEFDWVEADVSIKDIKLFVTKKRATTAQMQLTERHLASRPACYPIRRIEMREHLAITGSKTVSLDNIYSGTLPNRLIVGLVDNGAVKGDIKKNPFNFEHAQLDHACCYINGEPHPRTPFKPDFSSGTNNSVREYISLFHGIGKMQAHPYCDLTLDGYRKGNTLLCFNLSADGSDSSSGHFNPVRRGTMRLDLGFKEALAKTYSVILFAEFDSVVTIDRQRNARKLF